MPRNSAEVIYDIVTADGPEALMQWALLQPHVKILEENEHGVRLKINEDRPEVITGVLKRMLNDGIQLLEFRPEERRLDDAFIDMLGKLDAERKVQLTAKPLGR